MMDLAHAQDSGSRRPAPNTRCADLEVLFEKAPVAMLVVDAGSLAVLRANEAATRNLGKSRAELAHKRLGALIVPADRERLSTVLAASAATTDILAAHSSWNLANRDGVGIRLEVAEKQILQNGRPCFLLFQPDLPAAKPSDDGAAAPAFSFTALHDLKEPLHIVKGYLAILRCRTTTQLDPESIECLEQAYAGTLRMQAVVLNLLEFFRTDAKGIAPEPLDLDAAVDDALRGLSLQIQEAEAVVTHSPLPTVLADRFQMSRVLTNLLSNAIKFRGAAPPRVHLHASEDDEAWQVSVEDHGIGIAAKDLERVLQPFQRLHSTDEFPGTGLGLSISRKVIELHGGRLWLESQPGAGTTVHFTLPKRR